MKNTLHSFLILSVAAAGFFASCKKEKSDSFNLNKAPIANAGNDSAITLPTDSILMDGSLSTDLDGSITKWRWTKISWPASFAFSPSETAKVVVKNLIVGVYQFELTVTDDGGLSAKDTLQVTVKSPANRPPVANAGNDTTITLPANTVILDGSKSTDPDNNIANYIWEKVAGPASFSFATTNTVQAQVTNLVEGVYYFKLYVIDHEGLTQTDICKVNVMRDTSSSTLKQILFPHVYWDCWWGCYLEIPDFYSMIPVGAVFNVYIKPSSSTVWKIIYTDPQQPSSDFYYLVQANGSLVLQLSNYATAEPTGPYDIKIVY